MKSPYWPLALVLLASVTALLWLSDRSNPEAEAAASAASPLDADYDYYLTDMQTTRFGRDGQAVSQLQARRVTHYPDGDRAELEAPRFSILGAQSNTWQASAGTGTLTPDAERTGERLELQGEVILHKQLASGDFVEIRTTALTVYTSAREAVTAEPVTVLTGNSRLNSIGMRALLSQDHLTLNEGRGTHDSTLLR